MDADEQRRVKRIHFGMGPQGKPVAAISESGLFKLIMRCDKPVAKPFQDWVTKEVLPSIRKTGGYRMEDHGHETADVGTRNAIQPPSAAQLGHPIGGWNVGVP